jgi:hypothetical protein
MMPMKRTTLALVGACLLSGCAQHYDMVLTNGVRITNVRKPVLDHANSVYVYKDVAGNEHYITSGRVVEIKPHNAKEDKYFSGK